MKFCLFFLIIFLLLNSSCFRVEKIIISEIQVEKIEISQRNVPDSIILNNLNLDSFNYRYDKRNNTLFIDSFKIDGCIIIDKSQGDSIVINPTVDYISFKHTTVKNPSNKFKFEIDTIIIKNYKLESIEISQKATPYDDNLIRNEELDALLNATTKRLDSLVEILEDIIKNEPENSFASIVNDSYFNDLREVINETTDYLKHGPHKAEKAEMFLKKLGVVNLRLNSIEDELDDPENNTTYFSNDDDLYFDLGEFEIDPSKHMTTLNKYINSIITDINSLKESYKLITLFIRTTGFSDDVSVSDSLKKVLMLLSPEPKCDIYNNEKFEQDCYNQILSEQRAISVSNYAMEIVTRYCQKNNISIKITMDPTGYGVGYPSKISYKCPNNCKERRVVSMSRALLTN